MSSITSRIIQQGGTAWMAERVNDLRPRVKAAIAHRAKVDAARIPTPKTSGIVNKRELELEDERHRCDHKLQWYMTEGMDYAEDVRHAAVMALIDRMNDVKRSLKDDRVDAEVAAKWLQEAALEATKDPISSGASIMLHTAKSLREEGWK